MDIDPTMRVIVLGVSEDDETGIVACAEAGVVGYHMRSDSFDDRGSDAQGRSPARSAVRHRWRRSCCSGC
jgi:hypothetical protein